MGKGYYIAGCVFTAKHPETSARLQKYARERHGLQVVRCCVPAYKTAEFSARMAEGRRPEWEALPDSAAFAPGDTVFSVCHNCSAILEETRPQTRVKSVWELILEDEDFPYPDYGGQTVSVQDCWRSRDNAAEQAAVRALLEKMNFKVRELPQNHADTEFCGISLHRPSPSRNLRLAPRHFVENAQGKFIPRAPEEQKALMREHCARIPTDKVVACCHYCLEGLELGGANARHLARALFEPDAWD